MNILDEIAEKTRERIAEKAKEIPLSEVREAALDQRLSSKLFP